MTPSAREAIERCLTEQPAFGFTNQNKMQGAMLIEEYLAEAGYEIVRQGECLRPDQE